ncbi:MAG: methyltransferase domain-containing protein [Myxococcota bacterium]|nr:methyltransferase domain-containing protein [Myxococcota bacterium]
MLRDRSPWLRLDPKRRVTAWNRRYNALFEEAAGHTGMTSMGRFDLGSDIPSAQVALLETLIAPLPGGGDWLDLGSGLGGGTAAIGERADHAHGLELGPKQVEQARLRFAGERVHFHGGDIDRVPFPSDRFDVVTALQSLSQCRDLPQALHQAWTVLKPGGHLAIADWSTSPRHHQLPDQPLIPIWCKAMGGVQLASEQQWRHHLERLGFVDIRIQDLSGPVSAGFQAWADALSQAASQVGHRPHAALLSRAFSAFGERGAGAPVGALMVHARKAESATGLQKPA